MESIHELRRQAKDLGLNYPNWRKTTKAQLQADIAAKIEQNEIMRQEEIRAQEFAQALAFLFRDIPDTAYFAALPLPTPEYIGTFILSSNLYEDSIDTYFKPLRRWLVNTGQRGRIWAKFYARGMDAQYAIHVEFAIPINGAVNRWFKKSGFKSIFMRPPAFYFDDIVSEIASGYDRPDIVEEDLFAGIRRAISNYTATVPNIIATAVRLLIDGSALSDRNVDIYADFYRNTPVAPIEIEQRFLDGLSHCVFTPIINELSRRLDNGLCAQKERKIRAAINTAQNMQGIYAQGVPVNAIPGIANELGVMITVRDPLDREIIKAKPARGGIILSTKFLNTRINHLVPASDITVHDGKAATTISQREMNDLARDHIYRILANPKDDTAAIRFSFNNKTSNFSFLCSPTASYKVITNFDICMERFYNMNPLIASSKISSVDPFYELIKAGMQITTNCVIDVPQKGISLFAADMEKAYCQFTSCPFYGGFATTFPYQYLGGPIDLSDKQGFFACDVLTGSMPRWLAQQYHFDKVIVLTVPEIRFIESVGAHVQLHDGWWNFAIKSTHIVLSDEMIHYRFVSDEAAQIDHYDTRKDIPDELKSIKNLKSVSLPYYQRLFGLFGSTSTAGQDIYMFMSPEFAGHCAQQYGCQFEYLTIPALSTEHKVGKFTKPGIRNTITSRAHILAQVASYTRITTIAEALSLQAQGATIHAIQLDAVIYSGILDAKLGQKFRLKEFHRPSVQSLQKMFNWYMYSYLEKTNPENSGLNTTRRLSVLKSPVNPFTDEILYENAKIMAGLRSEAWLCDVGGFAKTAAAIEWAIATGLYCLFAFPSWKLLNDKRLDDPDRQFAVTTHARLTHNECVARFSPYMWEENLGYVRNPMCKRAPTVVFIDEVTKLTAADIKTIRSLYPTQLIVFIGDLNPNTGKRYQLGPVGGKEYNYCKITDLTFKLQTRGMRFTEPRILEHIYAIRALIDQDKTVKCTEYFDFIRTLSDRFITENQLAEMWTPNDILLVATRSCRGCSEKELTHCKCQNNKMAGSLTAKYTKMLICDPIAQGQYRHDNIPYLYLNGHGGIDAGCVVRAPIDQPMGNYAVQRAALTVDQTQGITIEAPNRLFLDLSKMSTLQMVHTALGRARSIEQVYIIAPNLTLVETTVETPVETPVENPNPAPVYESITPYSITHPSITLFSSTNTHRTDIGGEKGNRCFRIKEHRNLYGLVKELVDAAGDNFFLNEYPSGESLMYRVFIDIDMEIPHRFAEGLTRSLDKMVADPSSNVYLMSDKGKFHATLNVWAANDKLTRQAILRTIRYYLCDDFYEYLTTEGPWVGKEDVPGHYESFASQFYKAFDLSACGLRAPYSIKVKNGQIVSKGYYKPKGGRARRDMSTHEIAQAVSDCSIYRPATSHFNDFEYMVEIFKKQIEDENRAKQQKEIKEVAEYNFAPDMSSISSKKDNTEYEITEEFLQELIEGLPQSFKSGYLWSMTVRNVAIVTAKLFPQNWDPHWLLHEWSAGSTEYNPGGNNLAWKRYVSMAKNGNVKNALAWLAKRAKI